LTASFISVTPEMDTFGWKPAPNLTVTAGIKGNAMDSLASAVVDVERYAASKGWGQPPQLYALARKKTIPVTGQKIAILAGRQDDELISIEQDPLPPGEPDQVLASIHWPKEVEGCVLVTELLALPPDAEKEAPGDPAAVEKWAASRPDSKEARLAVGVLRDGSYTCCLQLRDDKELIISPELADDLVTALLVTFIPADTADPDVSPTAD